MPKVFPIPFAEALASRTIRQLLPTAAGSAELARLAPEIRERAFFSARVEDMNFLARADRFINGIVSPASSPGARPDRASPLNPVEARTALKDYLAAAGYQPEPGTTGGLRDLSSDTRLNLILKHNTDLAAGAGQFAVQNDPDIIDAFPALELIRREAREEERDWHSRWAAAGGHLYAGRMIARKDDPIWTDISAFGTPYPPFDFNSGMGTREIDRAEAEALGVVKRSTVVEPQTRGLNEKIEINFPQDISSGLADILQTVFETAAGKIILTPQAAVAAAAIDDVWSAAQRGQKLWRDYAPVTGLAAERILLETGLDVAGYTHTLDTDAVNHILARHGAGSDDRMPVTLQDLEALPWIVETGEIKRGSKTKQGLETIEYIKDINGEIFVLEEIRSGRKKLVPKTMYRKK